MKRALYKRPKVTSGRITLWEASPDDFKAIPRALDLEMEEFEFSLNARTYRSALRRTSTKELESA